MRRDEIVRHVTALAAPLAARLGLELVDVEVVGAARHQTLRVRVDRDGGVGVEECAQLSEALSRELDLYNMLMHPYTLEVASPGLDRPLLRAADFARFSGRTIALTTHAPIEGQRRFRGRLLGLVDGRVAIQPEGGREIRIAQGEIAQARLIVEMADLRQDFKRSSAAPEASSGFPPLGGNRGFGRGGAREAGGERPGE